MLPIDHHFPFDAVPVDELHAAAKIVVIMPERFQPRGNDLGFDGIEIFENAILVGGDSNNTLVVNDGDNSINVGGVARSFFRPSSNSPLGSRGLRGLGRGGSKT